MYEPRLSYEPRLINKSHESHTLQRVYILIQRK
jgi:hypothetical protein